MSNLVDHARRELELIGEEPWITEGLIKVVQAFADMGHSGGSAFICRDVVHRLLAYEPLSELTNDPAEWTDHSAISSAPLWQSVRNPQAFSEDGGKTYYLLDEREAAGSMETTPLHQAVVK